MSGGTRRHPRIVQFLNDLFEALQPRPVVAVDLRRDALVFVAEHGGAVILGHASLAQTVADSVALTKNKRDSAKITSHDLPITVFWED